MEQFAVWLGHEGLTMRAVVGTVLILVAAAIVAFALGRILRRMMPEMEARLHLSYETALTLVRMMSGAVWVVALLLVLNFWGVSVTGLWAILVSGLTIIGVGFLATWTMVSNVTASLFLAVWRPFRLGQTVELLPEGIGGRVVDRNMMFTVLREESGTAMHIPNNLFFQKIFRVSGKNEESMFEILEDQEKRRRLAENEEAG